MIEFLKNKIVSSSQSAWSWFKKTRVAAKIVSGWHWLTEKPIVQKIAAWPIWPWLWKWAKRIVEFFRVPFNTPRFHRFEILAMRIFFAIAVFQTMPLGPPYANWAFDRLRENKTEWFQQDGPKKGHLTDEAKNMMRPPLLPLDEMLPIADFPPKDVAMKKRNGLARWAPFDDAEPGVMTTIRKAFDFTYFSNPEFVKVLPWFVIPALLLYASGFCLPVALPILTWVSLGSRTLFNSQGSIHHGFQMLTLVLVAQTIVVLWHCRKDWKEAFGFRRAQLRNGNTVWDQFVRHAQIMIVACYVIAGVIKPIKSDGEWFKNSHMIGIQLVKTDRQNYYNDLDDKKYNREPVPVAKEMMERKNISRLFLAGGVMLEIFAFLALFSRFIGLFIGIALIAFHYLNDWLMGLYFFNNEKLVWIFFINIPFWIWWAYRKVKPKKPEDQLLADS